jgi:predicted TIM-barrel fold metal-dependent hydrolase
MTAAMNDRLPVIDADGHVTEPFAVWADHVEPAFRSRAPRLSFDERGRPCGLFDERIVMRHAMLLTLGPEYRFDPEKFRAGGADPRARLADMDAEGVDVAVLYPSIGLFVSEVEDAALSSALCRAYNNWLAEYCRVAPARLVGVALLPLVDVDAAVTELERATERLGFRGAFVRPNPQGDRPVHHPSNERLWQCAEALGVPVAIHEGLTDTLPTLGRDRFENPVMQHVLSHPFEQMAACAGLILSGVLERHPSMKVAFLESGAGWLPYWLGRLDSHQETWGNLMPPLALKPSEYFRRQCVISTDPEDDTTALVVQALGDESVVWASDYPHPDSVFPGAVTKSLASMESLPAASRRKIFAANAARLYGLDVS